MTKGRIDSIDALRGFALAGIIVVHLVEQYTASAPPDIWREKMIQGPSDSIIEGLIFIFVRGKFFALFSLLFGLSFFIQLDRSTLSGARFQIRFFWRLFILFIIGLIHHMFYSGDILTIYAVAGLILLIFYKANNSVVLVVALVLLLGLQRFATFSIFGNDNVIPTTVLLEGDDNYFNTLQNGSLFDIWKINLQERMVTKINFQIGIFGRGGLTLGFFLLGCWIGRIRILEPLDDHLGIIRHTLLWSIGGLFVFIVIMGILFSGLGNSAEMDSWRAMFALSAYDQANLFFTFMIGSGFLLLFQKQRWQSVLKVFAPYGRMALTNYFLQSIIGTFILFGWGLGYAGSIRNTYTFLLAIIIVLLQIILSHYWLRYFHYGPLEWLWRSANRFEWQSMVKKRKL